VSFQGDLDGYEIKKAKDDNETKEDSDEELEPGLKALLGENKKGKNKPQKNDDGPKIQDFNEPNVSDVDADQFTVANEDDKQRIIHKLNKMHSLLLKAVATEDNKASKTAMKKIATDIQDKIMDQRTTMARPLLLKAAKMLKLSAGAKHDKTK
jgi:hypothetical protein